MSYSDAVVSLLRDRFLAAFEVVSKAATRDPRLECTFRFLLSRQFDILSANDTRRRINNKTKYAVARMLCTWHNVAAQQPAVLDREVASRCAEDRRALRRHNRRVRSFFRDRVYRCGTNPLVLRCVPPEALLQQTQARLARRCACTPVQ